MQRSRSSRARDDVRAGRSFFSEAAPRGRTLPQSGLLSDPSLRRLSEPTPTTCGKGAIRWGPNGSDRTDERCKHKDTLHSDADTNTETDGLWGHPRGESWHRDLTPSRLGHGTQSGSLHGCAQPHHPHHFLVYGPAAPACPAPAPSGATPLDVRALRSREGYIVHPAHAAYASPPPPQRAGT